MYEIQKLYACNGQRNKKFCVEFLVNSYKQLT